MGLLKQSDNFSSSKKQTLTGHPAMLLVVGSTRSAKYEKHFLSNSNIAHVTQLAKAPRIAEVYLVSGLQILFENDSEGDRCCLHRGIRLEGWVIPPSSLCMHCLCNGGIEGSHSANKVEQHLNRQLLWGLLAAFAGSVGCSLPALVRLSK